METRVTYMGLIGALSRSIYLLETGGPPSERFSPHFLRHYTHTHTERTLGSLCICNSSCVYKQEADVIIGYSHVRM